jgi:hypothetical protein
MSFRLSVVLRNPQKSPTRVVIEEGTIFEVEDISTNPSQTLRAAQSYEFELGPGETQVFDLETQCQNPGLRSPGNDAMRAAPYVL